MNHALEQQIRERAYYLWLLEGCPHERSDEHWLSAEREVLALPAMPAKAKKRTTAKKVGAADSAKPTRTGGKRKVAAMMDAAQA